MPTLPQLIEDDIQAFECSLKQLLSDSEATAAFVLDKGGFIICQEGDSTELDSVTLGALAAASYAATQGMAELVKERDFESVYQQGSEYSMIVQNVDDHCLAVVVFKAEIGVGSIKYFLRTTVKDIARQLVVAQERAPDEGLDLSELNIADTDVFFHQRAEVS